MPVVHVSEWNEYKTAIDVRGNTVMLDADINAGGEIRSSPIYMQCAEIDGQGHTIYNYTSTHTDPDFYNVAGGVYIPIHDIKFLNVMSGGKTDRGFFQTDSGGRIMLTNVEIQGVINKSLLNNDVHATRCSCTFDSLRYLCGGPQDSMRIEECWFDIGQSMMDTNWEWYWRGQHIWYSYIKGSLDIKGLRGNGSILRGEVKSSIINIDIISSSSDTKTARLSDRNAYDVCLYNTDKIALPPTTTLNIPDNFTGLSDSNLKSSVAVAATGFSPFQS